MNASHTAQMSPPAQVPVGELENENESQMNGQTAPSAGYKTLDTTISRFSNSWCTFIGSEMQNICDKFGGHLIHPEPRLLTDFTESPVSSFQVLRS